jgi:hypothetical protein
MTTMQGHSATGKGGYFFSLTENIVIIYHLASIETIEFRLFEVILSVTDFCVLNFIKNNNRVEFL